LSINDDEIQEMLVGINKANHVTSTGLDNLISGIDYEEHPTVVKNLTNAIHCIKKARMYIREAVVTNAARVRRAAEIKPETGTDGIIADCHEKLKAGLAGLGPGESYSITVRKDVENVVTTDMSAEEFAKRFRQNYQA